MTADAGPALKELHEEFGDRVAFITLYVREAHPGELYPQPQSLQQKLEAARDYQERDQIPWPVAVDDLDGTLHRMLDSKPNSAYLVDRNGTVVERILWANDDASIREGVSALAQGRLPPVADRQRKTMPLLRGLGQMHEILGKSGRQAQQDLLWQVPPLYVLSRLAHAFRPLPPLARTVAATATLVTGSALLAAVGWRMWKGRS